MNKTDVKILFKSGDSIIISATKFKLSIRDNKISQLSWEDTTPRIMYIDLDDISAVFEL